MSRKIVTTEELKALVESGKKVYLPGVNIDEKNLSFYGDVSLLTSEKNRVTSVDFVGREEVQCISVEDEEHMYITDDFIPTHNTSNIVFLKSNDDSMLDTLSKMSGTKHTVYTESKSITKDVEKMYSAIDGKVSYTTAAKEEAVIKFNDLAFIQERNSIVFRAGDAPVWNRNSTILPMSWIMFKNTIKHPGHEYSLQTIPTLSSALDFDVRTNQPDFVKMLEKRISQAIVAENAKELHKKAYGLSDYEISMLDPDTYAIEIMELIRNRIAAEAMLMEHNDHFGAPDELIEDMLYKRSTDEEMVEKIAEGENLVAERNKKRYAEGQLSRADLIGDDGGIIKAYDTVFARAYRDLRHKLDKDHTYFTLGADGSLCGKNGEVYISKIDNSEMADELNQNSEEDDSRIYIGQEIDIKDLSILNHWRVEGEFYLFLSKLDSWGGILDGEFDRTVARLVRSSNDASDMIRG